MIITGPRHVTMVFLLFLGETCKCMSVVSVLFEFPQSSSMLDSNATGRHAKQQMSMSLQGQHSETKPCHCSEFSKRSLLKA